MKKEQFNYLYSFKYKNKDYIYLISKNYPFYFFEYHLDHFNYPDIDIFKELYLKFNKDNNLTFDIKNDLKQIKKKLNNIKFNINPLVRTTSGLLSLTLALSLCGCIQTKDKVTVTTEETSITKDYNKEEDIYNYFHQYDIEVVNREYDGNDYIFANEFTNTLGQREVIINSYEEFKKIKNIDFSPTYEDIIQVFKVNNNIGNKEKEIILKCLNNMKNTNELKELDLSVLYINAKRMKIEYLSSTEIKEKIDRESVYAYFDSTTGIVYLPNDKPFDEFGFIHEVLGHGTLAYREEIDDKLIVFDYINFIMLPTDNRYTGYSIGSMISEGGANMIAHFISKDDSDNFYKLFEEELRVIAELCNVSIGELFNNKGISFYDLMYKNLINTPVEYIFKMDAIYKGQFYIEFYDLMERLFIDATEEKFLIANKENQQQIIEDTIEIINNSYFNDKEELKYYYNEGNNVFIYNFNSISNDYRNSMNEKIRK